VCDAGCYGVCCIWSTVSTSRHVAITFSHPLKVSTSTNLSTTAKAARKTLHRMHGCLIAVTHATIDRKCCSLSYFTINYRTILITDCFKAMSMLVRRLISRRSRIIIIITVIMKNKSKNNDNKDKPCNKIEHDCSGARQSIYQQ
jgi:hypothetical protein